MVGVLVNPCPAQPISVASQLVTESPLLSSILIPLVTFPMSHRPRFWSKELAPSNICSISVTLPVSQELMFWLKEVASSKVSSILVTLPVFQEPMS